MPNHVSTPHRLRSPGGAFPALRGIAPLRCMFACAGIAAAVWLSAPSSCTPSLSPPSDVASVFARWFVGQNPRTLDTLLAVDFSCVEWDSVAATARRHSLPSGPQQVVLRDSSSKPFTVGYLPPPSLHTDSLYPLVIYLHGGIGTTRTDKGAKAYSMVRPLADTFDLFLASPSGNRHAPWWSALGLSRILQTVRYLSLHYPIDPDKVFLVGVSDGATGCYAAANTIPGPFAGFVAVSGFGGLLPQLGMPLVPTNLMQRPIYNINAGRDRLYSLEHVKGFLDRLTQAGVNVKRKFYPDEKHGFDYREREFGTIAGLIRRWSRPRRNGISWTRVPGYPNRADNLPLIQPQPEQTPPATIKGYWRDDTLVVRTHGVAEAVVHFPTSPPAQALVSLNDSPPQKLGAPQDPIYLMFRYMTNRCFPIMDCGSLYQLPIGK